MSQAFFDAVRAGDREQVGRFLDEDRSLAGAVGQGGLSAVLTAMYHGEPEIARLLMERGAPLNLFEAAAVGETARVRDLVREQPETVNAVAPDGFGPLGLAAFFGHLEVVSFLLEQGAEVNAASRNSFQVMPLHSAVAHRHLAIARLLLGGGAEVNARQQGGFTPLHGAVQNGDVEMVRLLLEHGADPDAPKDDGLTAWKMAAGKPEVAALLGDGRRDGLQEGARGYRDNRKHS